MRISRAEHRRGTSGRIAISVAAAALLLGTAVAINFALGRRAERKNPPRGRFVEVEGVQLHFLEEGGGRPIVLLHGNGAMAEDFVISGVFDELAAKHRVIAFDRPGFGYSERPRSRIWSASEQAKLLRHALRQLNVQNPIILGHSWGTMVALEMALHEPHDTGGLVLVSGYYVPTARLDVPLMAGPAVPVLGDLMRYTVSPLIGWLTAPMLFRKLFAPAQVTAAFKTRFQTAMALRPWQIRASAADTALMVPSAAKLAERYGDLDVRVTIISAPGDKIVDTQTQASALHHKLRSNQLWLVNGTGHMLHHTDPGEVVAAVEELAASPGKARVPYPWGARPL